LRSRSARSRGASSISSNRGRPATPTSRNTHTRTEIRYRFDDVLARTATRRFLSRYQRGSGLIIGIAFLGAPACALTRLWWAVSAFSVMALIYMTILIKYRRNATRLIRRLGAPEVTVNADENGITFSLPSYQTTAGWTPLREIWQFDDVWIFMPYGPSTVYS